jgi:hypothetical protein
VYLIKHRNLGADVDQARNEGAESELNQESVIELVENEEDVGGDDAS